MDISGIFPRHQVSVYGISVADSESRQCNLPMAFQPNQEGPTGYKGFHRMELSTLYVLISSFQQSSQHILIKLTFERSEEVDCGEKSPLEFLKELKIAGFVGRRLLELQLYQLGHYLQPVSSHERETPAKI